MSHWLHFPPEEILINCAHIVSIETVTSDGCPEKDQIDGFHTMKITMANGKEFIFPYHEESDGDWVIEKEREIEDFISSKEGGWVIVL
ncbi:MAG: hypothetical protein KDK55_01930 [Chlamydiia bacterium]|nr:hypothetical protein [Chlamydiia bacterium]